MLLVLFERDHIGEPNAPPLPFSRFDTPVLFETLRIGQRVEFAFGVGRTSDRPCARHVRPLVATTAIGQKSPSM
jgi:hypothetical protein